MFFPCVCSSWLAPDHMQPATNDKSQTLLPFLNDRGLCLSPVNRENQDAPEATRPMRIRIDGTLDHLQNKQHIPHAFSVPADATRLAIRFDYEPRQCAGQPVPNDLSLTLFDPTGARGARHCNPDRNLVLTARSATPGYQPGPLQPGTWTVWIDSHRIMPSETIRYFFEIDITDGPVEEPPLPEWEKGAVAARGPGWYRGDLHGHTIHSDGHWDVPDLVRYARERGLDFVT